MKNKVVVITIIILILILISGCIREKEVRTLKNVKCISIEETKNKSLIINTPPYTVKFDNGFYVLMYDPSDIQLNRAMNIEFIQTDNRLGGEIKLLEYL